ncbi:MAG: DUF4382 domain-containing protein [Deferrisomatales bacterium]
MKTWSHWKKLLGAAALGLLAAVAAGCGSGAGSVDAVPGDDTGEVVIGLTDAEGDFLRYEVEVRSIRLTRADGTVVETLPVATRVDFAELTELTEFVTAARVPNGAYKAAALTLAYTGADLWVEVAGAPVKALAVDAAGQPVGVLEASVTLDRGQPLVIAPGVPAHLTLDFDLAATHEVDTGAAPPRVTVRPVLVAEAEPARPKVHRVRGPLAAVDAAAESFVLAIRPRAARTSHFGHLRVETSPETAYEVDGRSALGHEGFALLAAKPLGAAVVAVGDLDPARRAFVAREVYAGSSVAGGELDGLAGTVIGRAGSALTVRGATLDRSEGIVFLHRDVTVLLGPDTAVTRQGSQGIPLALDAVSVGQRITALGTWDGAAATLDAAHLRLQLTPLAGTVAALRAGALDLALQHLDGRRPALFDFTGTGPSAADDADPASYTVDTGTLPLPGLFVGAPVRVLGFVTPFGIAPPDFQAHTVANASGATAQLLVSWVPATGAALTAAPTGLTLDVAGAPRLHHVLRAGIASALDPEPAATVVPEQDRGVYALARGGPTAVYGSFAAFAEALGQALAEGGRVAQLSASGRFENASQVFTARRLAVRLR